VTDRVLLPLRFDAERMRADVARLSSSDWVDHFVPANYAGRWRIAPLRAPTGAEHPVMMIYSDPSCTSFSDTSILARCPYLQTALAAFRCELDAVRLMALSPGSEIKEHRDHELSVEEGVARLHVPVTTDPEVRFYLNGEVVSMRPGECWYLRLSDPHRVVNEGARDRVHLVIDARVNDWLRGLLQAAKRGAAGS
jgi:mannose-6-phosphate isomerase-like protein (cupin superfamily)